MNRITLTGAQIEQLASFAGLQVERIPSLDELERETEFTIQDCPEDGVKGDDDIARHYSHIMYCTEYPDEGCLPLGDEVPAPLKGPLENRKLDTDRRVFFYEQDFYVLSNFSAFSLIWQGLRFDTSEAAYHWEKFPDSPEIQDAIQLSPSAHEAFKLAERYKAMRRPDWDEVKVRLMKAILIEKAQQHEYVRRKLLATGTRELIEDSWRDDYWGWGPNRDGQNMLGRLWMEVRSELLAASPNPGAQ